MNDEASHDDFSIHLAQTDLEIESCFEVMAQLRPHLEAADFVARVRSQQREGYQLALGKPATAFKLSPVFAF